MPTSYASPLSIYLHIPFCSTKCTYCAFNTYIQLDDLIPAFVEALIQEVRLVARGNPYQDIHTIYFGGGTPSLLTPAQFYDILNTIYTHFNVRPDAEISTEANPNDLNENYLLGLRHAGINRLSIGMQSANDPELQLFERRHNADTVPIAIAAARKAGFDNVSLDLIYGFPNQTMSSWQTSLNHIFELQPEHISMYALGLEDGTPMNNWVEGGKLHMPDDDLIADMYDVATAQMRDHGYVQYEISNWSKPGLESQHNVQYWRNLPYLGLGPGAHGYADGVRYDTILSPQRYIRAMQDAQDNLIFPKTPATNNAVQVTHEDEIAETLMMNLRLLKEGVSLRTFKERFGVGLLELHGSTLKKFAQHGLVKIEPDIVSITEQGRLLSNLIFRELI